MITLRFSTDPRSITGILIRGVTWSEFSHVDVCTPDGKLLGAQIDGVKARPAGYAAKSCRFLYLQTDKLTAEQEKKFWEFLDAQIGKPYDFGAIAGILIHRDWRNPNKWFCSELVAAAFEYAGVPLLRTDFIDRVSPGQLLMSPYLVDVIDVAPPVRAQTLSIT